jgi:hypothetical protein
MEARLRSVKSGVAYIVVVRKGGALVEVEVHGSRRRATAARRDWRALFGAEAVVYERTALPIMGRPRLLQKTS